MRMLTPSAWLVLAATAPAAPALGEKPVRWEYAELTFRSVSARPAGVDPDGNVVPAVVGSVDIKWITAAGEVEAKGWLELAEKLKAPDVKKDGSNAVKKVQVLNFLGAQGWEVMEQSANVVQLPQGAGRGTAGGSTKALMLKRRVP